MNRLGIVVSHPIQYNSPLFRQLAKTMDVVVIYCHNPSDEEVGMEGFGKKFQWDQDLISGYRSVFLKNRSKSPSLNKFSGCDCPDMAKTLKNLGVTHIVIYGWYLKAYLQALIHAKRLKIKVSVRGDSQLNPEESVYKTLFRKVVYPFLLRRYDTIFYVGNRNKDYLLKNGARSGQLSFSPHAIDQSFWHKNRPIAEASDRKKIIFVWIGKFSEKKRPQDAISAFTKALPDYPDMELWMIGSGTLYETCTEMSKNQKSIIFHGFKNQQELKILLNDANALLLTSNYEETWGLVVNECFSMGLPSIVSNSCGCSADLIEEGKTGYLFKKGDIEQLKNKILKLAQDLQSDKGRFSQFIEKKNEMYSFNTIQQGFNRFLNQENEL